MHNFIPDIHYELSLIDQMSNTTNIPCNQLPEGHEE